jgi:hypothetical protein
VPVERLELVVETVSDVRFRVSEISVGWRPRRENLALYYIDSFRVAGRNGIRFEHGAAAPHAPDAAEHPFCYRYALAPRSGTFTHWQLLSAVECTCSPN